MTFTDPVCHPNDEDSLPFFREVNAECPKDPIVNAPCPKDAVDYATSVYFGQQDASTTCFQVFSPIPDGYESLEDDVDVSFEASAHSTCVEVSCASDESIINTQDALPGYLNPNHYYSPKPQPEPSIQELKDGINLDSASISDL